MKTSGWGQACSEAREGIFLRCSLWMKSGPGKRMMLEWMSRLVGLCGRSLAISLLCLCGVGVSERPCCCGKGMPLIQVWSPAASCCLGWFGALQPTAVLDDAPGRFVQEDDSTLHLLSFRKRSVGAKMLCTCWCSQRMTCPTSRWMENWAAWFNHMMASVT